jgi:hypothetical protein
MTLLSACANRVAPTGGIKDVIPPKFIEAAPVNLNTNFKASIIELSFDELVMLKELPTQLVISPLIEPVPEVKALKNKVIIKINPSLRKNTTYTLNFGKAIADVHEGNALENFQYVFSTGEVLDSLICSGKVKDAATLAPRKGLTVMIYRNEDNKLRDSLVFKRKPDYFGRTDDQGFFNISNIAAGKYSIYALDDKNNNYIADDPQSESIAFADKVITIPQADSLSLFTCQGYPPSLLLKNAARLERGKALLAFNQPTDSIELKEFSSGLKWQGETEWSQWKDTLFIYMPDTIADSLNLLLQHNNFPLDTIHLKMGLSDRSKSGSSSNKLRIEILNSPETNGPSSAFVFSMSRPVKNISGEVILYNDTILINNTQYALKQDPVNPRLFAIDYKWIEGKNYKIILPGGLLKDRYGFVNDTMKFNLHIPTPETSALLNVIVKEVSVNSKYLLQLVNDQFEVKRQIGIYYAGAYNFSFIPPGLYRIRIVKDDNENGRWDIGSYGKNLQPEKVNVSGPLQLRANWELESEINCP